MAAEWVPSWLKKEDPKEEKVELPKELKESIENSIKTTMSPIEEKLKGLDSLVAFAQEYKTDKEKAIKDAADAKAAAEAKKVKEDKPSSEDLAAALLQDPEGTFRDLSKHQVEFMLSMRADQIKDQVFRDRAEEFPYYSGEVKTEVDKILSEQTLKFKTDPNAVANVYYTVVGKKQKDINDGKIKSRFASASGSSTNGTVKSEDGEIKLEMSAEMKRAAKLTGMSEEDFLKLAERAAKAGELEYV